MTVSAAPIDREFAGWVPTITGQLSFSLIGMGGAARDCVTANVEFHCPTAGHPKRHVVVLQRRVTQDLPFTPWPMVWLKPSIAAHYILIGETEPAVRPVLDGIGQEVGTRADEIGVLSGTILVVPHHEDRTRQHRDLIKDLKAAIAAAQDDAPRAVVTTDNELRTRVEQLISRSRAEGLTIISASFGLYRTGEFRLDIDDGDLNLENDDESRAFVKLLASQMYYFSKDISHRHYHHPNSQDNLLPLTPSVGDDESWRRETLWSLTRAVLEKRRRGRLPDYKSAMGILAYAEAFQGLLAKVCRNAAPDAFVLTENIAFYDFAHTRLSLEATIEEKGFQTSMWMQIQAVGIAAFLGAAALWIAALQVRDVSCNVSTVGCGPVPPYVVRAVISQIITEPWIPLLFMIAAGSVYVEWSRRSLEVMRPYARWASFLGDWLDAIGASASKAIRKFSPDWGDRIGAAVAWSFTTTVVVGIYAFVGAATRLWPWPPPIIIYCWVGSILLFAGVAYAVRRTFWPRRRA